MLANLLHLMAIIVGLVQGAGAILLLWYGLSGLVRG